MNKVLFLIIIIIIIIMIIDKELEKLEKYHLLKDEIARLAHAKSHCSVCCCWGSLEPYQSTLKST